MSPGLRTVAASPEPEAPRAVRFSVVSFAPKGVQLAVIGGCLELGDWAIERAPKLQCRLGETRLQSEPDFHWVDVPFKDLPADGSVEYKFVELDGAKVKWEDLGSPKQNRRLELDSERAGDVALLPVVRFAEGNGGESDHTGRFYQGVKDRGEISVRRVLSQLFVGSCPRQKEHIDYLKSSLGVTVVVNFQTEEDCKRNCVAGIGMEEDAHAVSRLYASLGMEYIWLPTFDMSTDGRAQMLPQASFLFLSLLRRGHVIYSHCNAGVGRSVAAACGCLHFGLGLSARQMQHVVAASRPVAFFDFKALERARPHYEAMFGSVVEDETRDYKCHAEALATLL